MNPFLALLCLLAGFGLTWWLTVKKVTREIPVTERVAADLTSRDAVGAVDRRAAAAGAVGVAGVTGAAALADAHGRAAASDASVRDAAVRDDSAYGDDADIDGYAERPGAPVADDAPYDEVVADDARVADVAGADAEHSDWITRLERAQAELSGATHSGDASSDGPGASVAGGLAAAGAGAVGAAAVSTSSTSDRLDPRGDLDDLDQRPARPVGAAAEDTVYDAGHEPTQPIQRPASIDTLPDDASSPAGYTVKGDKKAKLYLLTDDPDFDRARPDIWFLDEKSALEAGYAHYIRKPKADASAGGAAAAASTQATLPTDAPYGPGSAHAGADGSGPAGWAIKGNAQSMLYHTTDSPSYEACKAEAWFETEEAAQAAGFRRWDANHR